MWPFHFRTKPRSREICPGFNRDSPHLQEVTHDIPQELIESAMAYQEKFGQGVLAILVIATDYINVLIGIGIKIGVENIRFW
jgi:hypothetical protein